jgi:hypothetical protein
MVVGLVSAALMLVASAAAPHEYELTWTVVARQSGWRDHDPQLVAAAERSGRAVASLVRVSPDVLRLQWQGRNGGARV